jgi:hypothetical protein
VVHCSGSSVSPRAVEPVRSRKRTVTVLRCSCAPAGTAANEKPHSWQNFAPSLFACPQLVQTSTPTRLDRIPSHDNLEPRLAETSLTRLGHLLPRLTGAKATDARPCAAPASSDGEAREAGETRVSVCLERCIGAERVYAGSTALSFEVFGRCTCQGCLG